MKKSAAIIAAGLLLATCTATQNTAENGPTAQSAQNPAWDKQYGGADKSYDSRLLALREQIAPRFEVLTFKDPQTGKEMQYNLYTPRNLEPGRKDSLVMFIADASTAGKGVKAPLMQGYGGINLGNRRSAGETPCLRPRAFLHRNSGKRPMANHGRSRHDPTPCQKPDG